MWWERLRHSERERNTTRKKSRTRKTVGQRAVEKRKGQERVRDSVRDGGSGRDGEKRMEGGRRGLILPGLWDKLVLESRKRYDGERERKSHYPSIHPSYSPSGRVFLSRRCLILFWIHQGVRSAEGNHSRKRTAEKDWSLWGTCVFVCCSGDRTELKWRQKFYHDDSSLSQHLADLTEGAWRREVDNGRRRHRIKKCRNMARLCCDSWCAVVTFDTGDKSFLDSIVCRGNQLSWHRIIRHLICYRLYLNFLSIPTFLKGNSFRALATWHCEYRSVSNYLGKYFNLPATLFQAPACGSFELASCFLESTWAYFNLVSSRKSSSKVFPLKSCGYSVSFLNVNSVTAFRVAGNFLDPLLFQGRIQTVTDSLHVIMDPCVF